MKSSLTPWIACALLFHAALSPAFEIRLGSGEKDLARYREYGSTITTMGDVGKLATYAGIAPGGIPPDSALGKQIAHNRQSFQKDCDAAAQANLR